MKVGIMQPYFLPYVGYFQLIAAVDVFVVYDNIKYTKKGWINRNRFLQNGADQVFSLPLGKGSDHLNVCERTLSPEFRRDKLLAQFEGAYRRAPYFSETWTLLEDIVRCPENNLFAYVFNSIVKVCERLGLDASLQISSCIPIDHTLKAEDKVLALCKALGADEYINAIGGAGLYSRESFAAEGLGLAFLRAKDLEYPQFGNSFVPWLSIIDVLMFNPPETVRNIVTTHYEFI